MVLAEQVGSVDGIWRMKEVVIGPVGDVQERWRTVGWSQEGYLHVEVCC